MIVCKQEQHLQLTSERAIFWIEAQLLIISDLHIGKGMHFRKAGIPIPREIQHHDLDRLGRLIERFHPKELVITGDMFHSHSNAEVDLFHQWRQQYHQLPIILTKGNHDILPTHQYIGLGIHLVDQHDVGPFTFSHEPAVEARYCFHGHWHAGVQLAGKGKQRLALPCFHFYQNACVLPAFATFSGLGFHPPQPEDEIIAIADGQLMAVS
ncbi:MAG: ligase-associated DNA damage response endonuclease PdeM [Chitinophagales bacterium]